MFALIIFMAWLWKFTAIYFELQKVEYANSQTIDAIYTIKNYKQVGIPVSDLTEVDRTNNLVIPEWDGEKWVYYQIPHERILIDIVK